MPEKKSSESRRKLLTSIAVGGGAVIAGKNLPESWSGPVVDSVMLPAHAQTSDATVTGGGGGTFNNITNNSIGEDILDILAPPAYAIGITTRYCIDISITQENNVVTGVTVTRLCEDYCGEPSDELRDTLTDPVALENTGPDEWWGRVGPGNYQLTLSDVNPASKTLAKTLYRKVEGFIYRGDSCNCPCSGLPSDIRLKTNIEALSVSRAGYNLYQFQYIGEDNDKTYVGVMAQDILASHPEAVIQNESGYYMVRYDKLGLKMVTLDQWLCEGRDCVELTH